MTAHAYDRPSAGDPSCLALATGCTPAQLAGADIAAVAGRDHRAAAGAVPAWSASTARRTTATSDSPQCDGAGNVIAVKLWWVDKVGTPRFVVSVEAMSPPARIERAMRGYDPGRADGRHGGRPVRRPRRGRRSSSARACCTAVGAASTRMSENGAPCDGHPADRSAQRLVRRLSPAPQRLAGDRAAGRRRRVPVDRSGHAGPTRHRHQLLARAAPARWRRCRRRRRRCRPATSSRCGSPSDMAGLGVVAVDGEHAGGAAGRGELAHQHLAGRRHRAGRELQGGGHLPGDGGQSDRDRHPHARPRRRLRSRQTRPPTCSSAFAPTRRSTGCRRATTTSRRARCGRAPTRSGACSVPGPLPIRKRSPRASTGSSSPTASTVARPPASRTSTTTPAPTAC